MELTIDTKGLYKDFTILRMCKIGGDRSLGFLAMTDINEGRDSMKLSSFETGEREFQGVERHGYLG